MLQNPNLSTAFGVKLRALFPGAYGLHEIRNHVNDGVVTEGRINHGMVDRAVGPIDVKILLDEIGALLVDRIHELIGFLLTFAASDESPHFVFSGSVKKYAQRVLAVS